LVLHGRRNDLAPHVLRAPETVPAKWKLVDASSLAIGARDNVWLLHRPRTLLKPEESAIAAPP